MLTIDTQFTYPEEALLLLPPSFEEAEEKAVFENIQNLDAKLIGLPLVVYTLADLDPMPGRILFRYFAWHKPDAGEQKTVEFAAAPENVEAVRKALTNAGFTAIAVPDVVGLASGRAIAMIINEAAHLAEEGIAGEADIDLAMRLGTNYPIGPFAWAELWGEARTRQLLQALGREDAERYVLAKRFQ